MIILKPRAALGNQMFQYAYARSVALRAKTNLVIDTSWYSSFSPKDTPRTFLLDKYNIEATILDNTKNSQKKNSKLYILYKRIYAKLKRTIFKYSDYVYYPSLLTRPDNSTLDPLVEGFWNTELYFKEFSDTIQKELTLKNPLGEKASEKEKHFKQLAQDGQILVPIHVRRGDYVTNKHAAAQHGAKGVEYYSEALARMQVELSRINRKSDGFNTFDTNADTEAAITPLRITFILSSDDIEWVKESIVPLLHEVPNASYEILSDMPNIKDYEEIYLMSLCHHFIIANSSYSWWAAWLSTSAKEQNIPKIVIGPKKWTSNPSVNTKDVLPTDWIRI